MAAPNDSHQKVSKWGQRRRYLPSSRFSTERLDLILAKLKGPEDEEPGTTSPGARHKSEQDLSIQKEIPSKNAKTWNVYMHDSPFAKNKSIFEDLIADQKGNVNKEKQKDVDDKPKDVPKAKKLPSYDEFVKSSEIITNDVDNECVLKKSATLDSIEILSTQPKQPSPQQQKFEHDIDTVPTRDTENCIAPAEPTEQQDTDDCVSITSSGNDVTREGHHNDSGFLDELNENTDYKKGIGFSIEHGRSSSKSATLPSQGTQKRDGFVSQAKNWWQNKHEEQKPFEPVQVIAHHKSDNNNNDDLAKSQRRQSHSANFRKKQGAPSNQSRPKTPQFKDRFSSTIVKTPEEKKAERKHHQDNSNAPPLSMQTTEAFRIWKLREELDNRTREAEAYADEVDRYLPKSRPTTPTSRLRSKTPTFSTSRPTTPIDARSRSPERTSRSKSEGRKLPNIPKDRTRPTTPSSERPPSRNQNLDRLMAPTMASRARAVTPSREVKSKAESRQRPTTPTSQRPTTPTRITNRPVTPSRDRALSPTLDSRSTSQEKLNKGRYAQNESKTNPQAPVSNRARARRVQPAIPETNNRPTTPTRDGARTPTRDGARTPTRDGTRTPTNILEEASKPGISIRQRSLLQTQMRKDQSPDQSPAEIPRSKSADIFNEKANWPVAPPRRTRRRQGARMLPTVPDQPVRPKSPFAGRPVTPSQATEVPGEGEAVESPEPLPYRPSTLYIGSTSSSSNVFTSPERDASPPVFKTQTVTSPTSPQSSSSSSDYNIKSRSVLNKPDYKQEKKTNITKPSSSTAYAQLKSSSANTTPFYPPQSPPYRPVTPIESHLRPMTPTKSILKKTPRTHSADDILNDNDFFKGDFNATSSPPDSYEMYSQSLPRDPAKRSAWKTNTVTPRTNLRRPSTNLDKRTSPSFENLGKALQESLSPLKSFQLNDTSPTNNSKGFSGESPEKYKRETPKNKRDSMRRNTIEGLPSPISVSTSTLTLPHRRPQSKDRVKWNPSSFKSNTLGQRLSRSTTDLRGLGSREDISNNLTKCPSMETLSSKSSKPFSGGAVSNRFRRFESMDALEILETGSMTNLTELDESENSKPDFVQCEFFV